MKQLTETQDMVLSFIKFGIYLFSVVLLLWGIGLISVNEYLLGGLVIGQFPVVLFSLRHITYKFQSNGYEVRT